MILRVSFHVVNPSNVLQCFIKGIFSFNSQKRFFSTAGSVNQQVFPPESASTYILGQDSYKTYSHRYSTLLK